MQIIRTVAWVVLLIAILAFTFANWGQDVSVVIWDGLYWDTKLPAVVIISFLLGLIPMWLIHRGMRWRLERRISSLETAARSQAATSAAAATAAAPPRTLGEEPSAIEDSVEQPPKPKDDILG